MGVKPHEILDALKNPLKTSEIITDASGRRAQRFFGKYARVVVNPDTKKIISVNPMSSKLLKQLKK